MLQLYTEGIYKYWTMLEIYITTSITCKNIKLPCLFVNSLWITLEYSKQTVVKIMSLSLLQSEWWVSGIILY